VNIYEGLFGDQELEDVLVEMQFPEGSRLAAARARMWEGNAGEASTIAAGGEEPWASLISAAARIQAGLSAKQTLLPLAEDARNDSRVRLWAWHALRKLGEKPSSLHASEVLGFVLEVTLEEGLDVLAAYSDGSVRFLGHADQLVTLEATRDPIHEVVAVIANAFALLKVPPAPRDKDAKAPEPENVRMTALSANGLHRVTVPWDDVEGNGPYEPLFRAATKLLMEITLK
jgi:hypothetical protein